MANTYLEKIAKNSNDETFGQQIGAATGFYSGLAAGGYGGYHLGGKVGGKVYDNLPNTKMMTSLAHSHSDMGTNELLKEIQQGPMRVGSSKHFEKSKSILNFLDKSKKKFVDKAKFNTAVGGAITLGLAGAVAGHRLMTPKDQEKKASENRYLDKIAETVGVQAFSGTKGAYTKETGKASIPSPTDSTGTSEVMNKQAGIGDAFKAGLGALKSTPKADIPFHEQGILTRGVKGVGHSIDSFMKTMSGHNVRLTAAVHAGEVPTGDLKDLSRKKLRQVSRFNEMSDTEMRNLMKTPEDKAAFDNAVKSRTGARVVAGAGALYTANKYLDHKAEQSRYGGQYYQ